MSGVLKHVTLDGVRLHLKTDENKLWINGYYVLYLNDTAKFIIESLIDSCYEAPREKVMKLTIKKIMGKYKVDIDIATKDFQQIIGIINSFSRNEVPLHLVGMKKVENENLNAPNRIDLSLTYDCNNHCTHCYLPDDAHGKAMLTTSDWKKVIDKLWIIGIPQMVFTGGECTLRSDLVELVMYAKQFTTGHRTRDNQDFIQEARFKPIIYKSQQSSLFNKKINRRADHWQFTLDKILEFETDKNEKKKGDNVITVRI